MTENGIQWGQCHNDGCDEPCPWDMSGIILFNEIYCSPDCAREGLKEMPDKPHEVVLHDPQFAVDRENTEAPSGMVDLVIESSAPLAAIQCHEDWYPGEFRIDLGKITD